VGSIAHDQERSLLNKARFVLVYLGTPVAWFGDVQVIPTRPVEGVRFLGATQGIGLLGVLLLAGMAWHLNRRHRIAWSVLAPLLAIGAYAVGSAVLTSFARITSGQEQAGAPRYTSVSNLLWLSVFLLALVTLPRLAAWPRRVLAGLMLVLTVIVAATTSRIALAHAENAVRRNAFTSKIAVIYPNIDDATLLTLFPDLNRVKPFLAVMAERKLNVFRNPRVYPTAIPLDIGGAEFDGISLVSASPLGVRFRGRGRKPHLILSLDHALPEDFAVSLKIRLPFEVVGTLHWIDDRGRTVGPGHSLTGVKMDGAYWFAVRRTGASGPIRALELGFKPVRGETCDFEGTFRELKVWVR